MRFEQKAKKKREKFLFLGDFFLTFYYRVFRLVGQNDEKSIYLIGN